jgi:hypothetical protein
MISRKIKIALLSLLLFSNISTECMEECTMDEGEIIDLAGMERQNEESLASMLLPTECPFDANLPKAHTTCSSDLRILILQSSKQPASLVAKLKKLKEMERVDVTAN